MPDIKGPVALGTELTLEGAHTINYQIDGGKIQIYSDAIIIDKPCTITAWGGENNKSGSPTFRQRRSLTVTWQLSIKILMELIKVI